MYLLFFVGPINDSTQWMMPDELANESAQAKQLIYNTLANKIYSEVLVSVSLNMFITDLYHRVYLFLTKYLFYFS